MHARWQTYDVKFCEPSGSFPKTCFSLRTCRVIPNRRIPILQKESPSHLITSKNEHVMTQDNNDPCLLRRITDASLPAGWTNFQDNKTLRSHAFNSHRYDTINIRPTFLIDLETTRFRGWCVSMEKRSLVRRFRYMQTPF